MTNEHTPGPWAYDGAGRVDAVHFRKPTGNMVDDGSGMKEYIGGLVALPYSCEAGTMEANARLIAAAPELLAACEKAVQWLDGWASAEPYVSELRAAIAKATGESA